MLPIPFAVSPQLLMALKWPAIGLTVFVALAGYGAHQKTKGQERERGFWVRESGVDSHRNIRERMLQLRKEGEVAGRTAERAEQVRMIAAKDAELRDLQDQQTVMAANNDKVRTEAYQAAIAEISRQVKAGSSSSCVITPDMEKLLNKIGEKKK